MMMLREETRIAVGAVREALAAAHAGAAGVRVEAKGALDVVTDVDVRVEDVVRGVLRRELGADAAVLGEERGGVDVRDGGTFWVVDPICGTRNFASGLPLWCVNLALVEDGAVTAAVVGDPSRGDELVVAQRGEGAWALAGTGDAGVRLSVSRASETVAFEDSHSAGPERERCARFVGALVRAHAYELRSLSTSLTLPYLAAGRVAAYAMFWTSAIHAAAGAFVAAEAGAVVTDLDGAPYGIESSSLLAAADAALHAELLALAA
ncbi:inositol monophosphatase family protein [Conexibacter woesei]|uniref:inositol monophosphatase family protein n=1 Tax=Conexibacter woesei TaxID=191495 RepID=UPI00041BCBA7|nr:inositol monophosphatase family protein [Conexibacter woesei]